MLNIIAPVFALGEKAGASPTTIGSLVATVMPMVIIFGIMYLLLIRPQQKKAGKHQEMLNRVKAGDSVITNGGIYGTVTGVTDKSLTVRIADKVEVQIARSAVATLVQVENENK